MSQTISRVLHVVATLDRGGTEVSCLGLVRALAELGIDNKVAAVSRSGGGIIDAMEPLVGPPKELPQGRLARMKAFRAHVDQVQPDAVIFHFFTIEHVLLGAVARWAGVRRIVIAQGNPAPQNPSVRGKVGLILAATRRLGIALVSASAYIERTMAEVGPLPTGSRVIHNGCDTSTIATRAEVARQDTPKDELAILMVARLDSIKDHDTLFRAFAELPGEIQGRRLVLKLAGDGALRETLEHQVQELGVTDRVQFLGARSDIPELLGRSAVFCLSTTRDEGFGVVLIEALAAGTPVVASNVPACREVLGETFGTLVAAAEVTPLKEALHAAIMGALQGQDQGPPLAQVAERYDISIMAKSYLGVLQNHPK